jgi:hypothetical protein
MKVERVVTVTRNKKGVDIALVATIDGAEVFRRNLPVRPNETMIVKLEHEAPDWRPLEQ